MGKGNHGTILCDTNVLIYLYEGKNSQFGPQAKMLIEDSILVIPPIAQMELDYLHEIGKTNKSGHDVISYLLDTLSAVIDITSLLQLLEISEKINWTRDPFDRLIVANAEAVSIPILTKDRAILNNYNNAKDLRK